MKVSLYNHGGIQFEVLPRISVWTYERKPYMILFEWLIWGVHIDLEDHKKPEELDINKIDFNKIWKNEDQDFT